MTESSETKGPAPMEGHGAYNRSSLVQAAGSSPAVPLLEKAAQQVSLPAAPEPVVIVDYGSSEGRNSLIPLRAAISILPDPVGREPPSSVVHTGLPGKNFDALFHVLVSDPGTYLPPGSPDFP